MKTFKQLREEVNEACWKGYRQDGNKMKGGKMVPNCVPTNEEVENVDEAIGKLPVGTRVTPVVGASRGKKATIITHGEFLSKNGHHKPLEAYHHAIKYDDGTMDSFHVSDLTTRLQEEIEQLDERGANKYKRSTESGAGLTRAGVMKHRREHPGSKLSTAVTTEPSKLKKGSKAWNRRKSFCARMSGMKGPMKDDKGRPTRKAMSLRRWHCE